jgi:hypothetical protein
MISIFFTKRSNLGSWAIRRITKGDCSHVAIGFDCKDNGTGIVFHQSTGGLHVNSWFEFRKKYVVVHRKDKEFTLLKEESVYQDIIERFENNGYDYQAIIFWIIAVVKSTIMNKSLPAVNEWQNKKSYLCTEILSSIIPICPTLANYDLSMTSPTVLWEAIK